MNENLQSGLQEIPLEAVLEPDELKVRKFYNEEALDELSQSFSEIGNLQPILVRPTEGGKFELVLGSRRLRAARKLGKELVSACVVPNLDNKQALEMALSENLQKEDLTPFEEAWAVMRLMKDHGMNLKEVANRIGKADQWVAKRIKLLSLPPELQELISHQKLSMGHVDLIASAGSREDQVRLAKEVIDNALSPVDLRTHIHQEQAEKELNQKNGPPLKRRRGRPPGSGSLRTRTEKNSPASAMTGKRMTLKIQTFTDFLSRSSVEIPGMSGGELENVRNALYALKSEIEKVIEKVRN